MYLNPDGGQGKVYRKKVDIKVLPNYEKLDVVPISSQIDASSSVSVFIRICMTKERVRKVGLCFQIAISGGSFLLGFCFQRYGPGGW